MIIGGLVLLSCGDDTTGAEATGGSSGTATIGSAGVETMTGEATTTGEAITTSGATTAVDTTAADSTGPESLCGNGELDPGEECDDANLIEDDQCYSNCLIPYEVLWTSIYDGGAFESARSVRFDAQGNLYVLGISTIGFNMFDLWLRQYLPDGSEGWTWTYSSPVGGIAEWGVELAWHPSGDLIIVGSDLIPGTSFDILVIRLNTSDQSVVWSDAVDGPNTGDADIGQAVAVDADGSILVGGKVGVPGVVGLDAGWLRRYDADGNEVWTVIHESELRETSRAVVVDDAGYIYHVGVVDYNVPEDYYGWVRKLDAGGNELWVHYLESAAFLDAALDAENNLVLTGFESGDIWMGKFDPDFNELGSTSFDAAMEIDRGQGVAMGAGGDLYLAGFVTVPGQDRQIWAGRYTPDASLRWWSHSYGNDRANLSDSASAIAVSDDESRVAIVGVERVSEEDSNGWVRVLQNNPVP